MSLMWNFMKSVIVIFVAIFLIVGYTFGEQGRMSKFDLFVVIIFVSMILLLFLNILEGMPTYLRVGERYKMQYYFALPNDQGYILSLLGVEESLPEGIIKTIYFVKKIVIVGNSINRKQIIPYKFLVTRKEGDIFYLRAIK